MNIAILLTMLILNFLLVNSENWVDFNDNSDFDAFKNPNRVKQNPLKPITRTKSDSDFWFDKTEMVNVEDKFAKIPWFNKNVFKDIDINLRSSSNLSSRVSSFKSFDASASAVANSQGMGQIRLFKQNDSNIITNATINFDNNNLTYMNSSGNFSLTIKPNVTTVSNYSTEKIN